MKTINKIFIIGFLSLFFYNFTPPNNTYPIATFKAIKMSSYVDTFLLGNTFLSMVQIFEKPTIAGLRPYKTIKDGDIILNNIKLGFNERINMYIDSIHRDTLSNIKWDINSSNLFNNRTFSISNEFPVFNSIDKIPNMISKSQNCIIQLGNVNNCDKIEFNIVDGTLSPIPKFYRVLPGNTSNIVIHKNDLACLLNKDDAEIRISFVKLDYRSINNETVVFENRKEIIKKLKIVN
jgi:hypothetical protein